MRFTSGAPLVLSAPGSDRTRPAPVGTHLDGRGILVPLLTSAVPAVSDQFRVGLSLARPTEASLHVLDPVTGATRTLANARDDDETDRGQELRKWTTTTVSDRRRGLLSPRKLVGRILSAIETNDIDTLVLPGSSAAGTLRREVTERLALRAACDVVTVNGQHGLEPVPSILLAVAGGPHSQVATDAARRLAVDRDAWIDVLHVVPPDAMDHRRERAETYVETAVDRIDRPEATSTWILEADDTAAAIAEQSAYYPLTVIGAPTTGPLRRFVAGSTNRSIRAGAQSVVLSTRSSR